MDLSSIEKQIQETQKEIKDNSKLTQSLEILEKYSGVDRVIKSEEALEEIRERKSSKGFLSKLPRLDDITGGFKEGQLIVVSAPTGQGKTQWLQSLTHTFNENEISCLWFNYETGEEEFFERFGEKIPSFLMPRKIKESSIEWLKMRILEGIAKFNTKVIFIDHLHYLLDMNDLSKAKNVSLLIGMLMRDLKRIAIMTKTTIFLVSHMTKTQLEKTPTIEDLRDSSFVGQESDMVIMIWRHREKDPNSPAGYSYTNESRLIVAKNRRTGRLGYVKMIFNQGRFTELTNL